MRSSLSFCSSISDRDANGLQSRWLASSLWPPVSSSQLALGVGAYERPCVQIISRDTGGCTPAFSLYDTTELFPFFRLVLPSLRDQPFSNSNASHLRRFG